MLRKVVHIVLSLTLLVSTTGFTITKHYCGDKVESVGVDSIPESCCEMGGCCHNESTHYQVEDDFSITVIDNHIQVPTTDILFSTVFVCLQQEIFAPGFTIFSAAESPPPLKTQVTLSLIQAYLC